MATPPLNGLILPGITRQSVLELAKEWDEFHVEEREFTMDQLIELNNNDQVRIYKLQLKVCYVHSRTSGGGGVGSKRPKNETKLY